MVLRYEEMRDAMRRLILFLILIIGAGPMSLAVDYDEKYYVPFREDSLEHFCVGACGTYIGSQVLQYGGMPKGPAIALSAAGALGATFYKEYAHDPQPSINDLIAGTLGTLVGSLFAIRWSFDFHQAKKPAGQDAQSLSLPWSSPFSLRRHYGFFLGKGMSADGSFRYPQSFENRVDEEISTGTAGKEA